MGKLQAMDTAELVKQGTVPLEGALRWHLRGNHYPPVSPLFIPVCLRAIRKARAEQWEARVRLPPGRKINGSCFVAVSKIVEDLHLDAFLEVAE